ncbi:MAG: hypothetical protein IJQ57_00860 [Synergistaceae bacterium]|nr:hypothetical protein [Synergistaceae bacterium]
MSKRKLFDKNLSCDDNDVLVKQSTDYKKALEKLEYYKMLDDQSKILLIQNLLQTIIQEEYVDEDFEGLEWLEFILKRITETVTKRKNQCRGCFRR